MIIDVSVWQQLIDWDKVITNPEKIEGVFIRTNVGVGAIDPNLVKNANGATKVGILVGYYHFATLNRTDVANDAKDEANFLIGLLKTVPEAKLPVVLDIEENKIGLKPAEIELWVTTFFDTMKSGGYMNLMLYSYSPFLNVNLPANHKLGVYPLWVAAYAPKFMLPRGWTNAKYWQYSGSGRVNGIKVNVDLTRNV